MSMNCKLPRYIRIYQKLRQNIIRGEFERGAKIGIIRDLSKKYGVANDTIRKAVYLLETEGLLSDKQGFGICIPERANLTPIDLDNLIKHKNLVHTLRKSQVSIYSAKWVRPGYRLAQIYGLEEEAQRSLIYRVFLKMDVYNDPRLKGLMTLHLSENLHRALGINESLDPYGVLIQVSEWLETNVTTVNEIMRPELCTDEDANLLGVLEGTPVFRQEFLMRTKKNLAFFWEFISTANISTRKVSSWPVSLGEISMRRHTLDAPHKYLIVEKSSGRQ